MTVQIPVDLGSFTPEWFTQILTGSGVINHASITAIDSERIGEGQGFVGQVIRFRLTYHMFEESAPESIIAKISHPDPNLRKKISDKGLYKREITFYKELADKISMRVPYCYFCDLDEETGNHVLLLEDLRNGRIGDTLSGCSRQEAERIIDHLVPFHAAWWQSPELESMDWVLTQPLLDAPEAKEQWQQQRRNAWNGVEDIYAVRIPTPIKEVWPQFVQHGDRIRRASLAPPLTLCRGDYKLDNFFFSNEGGDISFVVFDWQSLRHAQGALDLAYFMILNLEPELRRQAEKDLLHRYCAGLKEHGVKDYGLEQCFHSYKIALYNVILLIQVGLGATLDFSSDRARALSAVSLARTSEAIIDHPILELI